MNFKLLFLVLIFGCATFSQAFTLRSRRQVEEVGATDTVPVLDSDTPIEPVVEVTTPFVEPISTELPVNPEAQIIEDGPAEPIAAEVTEVPVVEPEIRTEVIEHVEPATTIETELIEHVEPVTKVITETIEHIIPQTTVETETIYHPETVTELVPEVIEHEKWEKVVIPETIYKPRVLTTMTPHRYDRVELVTEIVPETKYHPQPMTTMVPETINHIRYNTVVVPEEYIVNELMTTMIPQVREKVALATTIVPEEVPVEVAATTVIPQIVEQTRTDEYVQPGGYVHPQPLAGVVYPAAEQSFASIEEANRVRKEKIIDFYTRQLESAIDVQTRAQQQHQEILARAEAERLRIQQQLAIPQPAIASPLVPAITQPAVLVPGVRSDIAPVAVGAPPAYTTLQEQINAQIAQAQANAQALHQKVLADVARIQEENRQRVEQIQAENAANLARIQAGLGTPAVVPGVNPCPLGALPGSIACPPTVPAPGVPQNVALPGTYQSTYVAENSYAGRLKRQIEAQQLKFKEQQEETAQKVKEQQMKIKAEVDRLQQQNADRLKTLTNPVTVRPTVVLPETTPVYIPSITLAPVLLTTAAAATLQPAVDQLNAQLAAQKAQTDAQTRKMSEEFERLQAESKIKIAEAQANFQKLQEETKLKLAQFTALPEVPRPTLVAPGNPIIRTVNVETPAETTQLPAETERPTVIQPTIDANTETMATKLKRQLEEQKEKAKLEFDQLTEQNRQALATIHDQHLDNTRTAQNNARANLKTAEKVAAAQ